MNGLGKARYWNLCNFAAWSLSFIVLGSGLVGAAIGWQGKSEPVRIQNIIFPIVSSFLVFLTILWLARIVNLFRNRFIMTPEKTATVVRDAIAEGLLPSNYKCSLSRDRQVAKIIRYDRRIGLTETEIKKDLENVGS